MIAKTASDRRNRVLLAIVGLLLLAAGAYGLLRGWGAFGSSAAHDVVLSSWLRRTIHNHNEAFWVGVLVLSCVIAYLGYRWLRAQLPVAGRGDTLRFAGEGPDNVELRAAAVAGALADDVERHPSVLAAAARVEPGDPLGVHMRVDVEDGADIAPVREFIAGEVMDRLRHALELNGDGIDARIHIRLADEATRHLN